jgi:hypothetical protein
MSPSSSWGSIGCPPTSGTLSSSIIQTIVRRGRAGVNGGVQVMATAQQYGATLAGPTGRGENIHGQAEAHPRGGHRSGRGINAAHRARSPSHRHRQARTRPGNPQLAPETAPKSTPAPLSELPKRIDPEPTPIPREHRIRSAGMERVLARIKPTETARPEPGSFRVACANTRPSKRQHQPRFRANNRVHRVDSANTRPPQKAQKQATRVA